MADAFYEVDEQLRAARLKTLFRRSWPYAAGVLALVLVAASCVWAWSAYETAAEGKDSQRYADALTLLASGDTAGGRIKFAAIARDGTPTYRALALMQEAGVRLKAQDAPGAVALFDQAAAVARDPITRDAARLRAAFLIMDTAPYDQIRTRLQPLTATGRPFAVLAREGLAVAELASGRTAEAKGDFEVLSLSSDVSDASRARANAALGMIQSGAAANLSAIAHAAVGLKPAPPPAQSGLTPEQMAALRAQVQTQGQGGAPAAAQPSAAPAETPPGTPQ